ncbi:MAG: hypothetical protein R2867_20385 [Caldilineaceae bacterium]
MINRSGSAAQWYHPCRSVGGVRCRSHRRGPLVIDRSGDRDGLPNVLLKQWPLVARWCASDVSAISSAVIAGDNGLLVNPVMSKRWPPH